MIEELKAIKEQLFDAPNEVKESFNEVVKYFSSQKLNWTPTHKVKPFKELKKGSSCIVVEEILDKDGKSTKVIEHQGFITNEGNENWHGLTYRDKGLTGGNALSRMTVYKDTFPDVWGNRLFYIKG